MRAPQTKFQKEKFQKRDFQKRAPKSVLGKEPQKRFQTTLKRFQKEEVPKAT